MNKAKLPQGGKNKRLLVISIVAVSVLIIAGTGYFFYLIYHKDEPKFVPGDTRGEVREGIKENIAEPLADVWPAVGEPLVNAVYTTPAGTVTTDNWQTYTNKDLGITLKYPGGWKASTNDVYEEIVSSLSFWSETSYAAKKEGALPDFNFTVYRKPTGYINIESWLLSRNPNSSFISNMHNAVYNNLTWIEANEAGDPDHYVFVVEKNNMLYEITSTELSVEVDNVIQKLQIN